MKNSTLLLIALILIMNSIIVGMAIENRKCDERINEIKSNYIKVHDPASDTECEDYEFIFDMPLDS